MEKVHFVGVPNVCDSVTKHILLTASSNKLFFRQYMVALPANTMKPAHPFHVQSYEVSENTTLYVDA